MEPPSKRQKQEPLTHLPPLMSVRVLCRERPSILGIAHVVAALDAFLDWSPRCTVAKACALCSPRLLRRVLAHDARELAGSVKSDVQFRQWQFEHGMTSAVASGNLELVQALVTHFRHLSVSLEVIKEAIFHGRLEILKWLHANRQGVKRFCCDVVGHALDGNHFEVAKWLRREVSPSDSMRVSWAELAAQNGRLDMVKWAYGQATCIPNMASESVVAAAVNRGHLDILVWLFENICGDRPCFSVSLSMAIYRGHLDVIEWMLRNQRAVCGPLDSAAAEAALCGRLDILRLLHAYKIGGDFIDAMDFAASNGNLDMIKWLHANNVSGCTRSAMDHASLGGSLDVVRWLHENRSEGCSRNAMDWAASNGHLEVLQWLAANRTEGCSPRAMNDAACNGHMEVLRWLAANRTEGCSPRAMNDAASNGHLDIVKWLHINRTEGCTFHAMDAAAMNGHLAVVKWLHVNRTEGCTVNAMDLAASRGHLEVVKWLHANRTEGCTSSAIRDAIVCGKMEIALFLHYEREECDLVSAVRRNSWHRWIVVDWLYCHYPPDLASALVATLRAEL